MGGPVSDFVFGFSADPGHDLLEILRKSRVASQARVDAARQVGDTVGPSEAEHGSQFMQRDLAVGPQCQTLFSDLSVRLCFWFLGRSGP